MISIKVQLTKSKGEPHCFQGLIFAGPPFQPQSISIWAPNICTKLRPLKTMTCLGICIHGHLIFIVNLERRKKLVKYFHTWIILALLLTRTRSMNKQE